MKRLLTAIAAIAVVAGSALPSFAGMPPRSFSSHTRLDSVSANWPSRKKASRGVVAIQ